MAPTSTVPSDVTIGVIIGSDGGPEAGATREQKARGLLRRNVAPILDNEFIRAVRDRLGHEMPSEEAAASDAAVAATGGGAVAVGSGAWTAVHHAFTSPQDPEHFDAVGDDWDIEARAQAALAGAGLDPTFLDRRIGELSGGEAVLVAIALGAIFCPGRGLVHRLVCAAIGVAAAVGLRWVLDPTPIPTYTWPFLLAMWAVLITDELLSPQRRQFSDASPSSERAPA